MCRTCHQTGSVDTKCCPVCYSPVTVTTVHLLEGEWYPLSYSSNTATVHLLEGEWCPVCYNPVTVTTVHLLEGRCCPVYLSPCDMKVLASVLEPRYNTGI